MGQTTYIKSAARPLSAEKVAQSFNLHLDVPLLVFIIALLVFGLLMVYSASWKSAQMDGEADNF